MQIKKVLKTVVAAGFFLLPTTLLAQSSSLNTFSPYTMYGIGDMTVQGPAFLRSMGGAGIAYREPGAINTLNPASMSAMYRKSFLFNFGMEGKNTYLKDSQTTSSNNTFNVRDVAIQFPLGKGIAFGVSVTPFSSIGYKIQTREEDADIIADLGAIRYIRVGEGDITQAKAGIGWEVFKDFSIGAEMIYYKGLLRRSTTASIFPVTGEGTFVSGVLYNDMSVSRIGANFGMQYSPVRTERRLLTFGATYQPKLDLRPEVTRTTAGSYAVTQVLNELPLRYTQDFALPHTIGAGVFYHNLKMSIGADYVYQKWDGINADYSTDNVSYRDTHTIKAGWQYTPNSMDVRRFMKRLTYRLGVRYSDYYLKFGGKSIAEKAVTAGVGVPISMGWINSNINIGLEYGQMGTTKNNQIKHNYFKFSIGLSLFGSDDWFKKYKYD